jgi:hypothetical protein
MILGYINSSLKTQQQHIYYGIVSAKAEPVVCACTYTCSFDDSACASCRRELLYSCDVERKGFGQVSLLLDVILCHLLYALYYNST